MLDPDHTYTKPKGEKKKGGKLAAVQQSKAPQGAFFLTN